MYIHDDEIAALDSVSLVQKQTELVQKGREACLDTHADGSQLGFDVYEASVRQLAFGPDFSQLASFLNRLDWKAVLTVLELIGKSDSEIVLAGFPKGREKPARYASGSFTTPFNPNDVLTLLGNGYSLGLIGGNPAPRPTDYPTDQNWGQCDHQIESVSFIGFELDPLDPALQDPHAQMAVLQEKCPDLFAITCLGSFSGNKSTAGFVALTEPVAPFEVKALVQRLAKYIQDRAPELNPDFSVCNPARIWRLPGYPHQTTGRRSELVWTKRVSVSAEELAAMLPYFEVKTRDYRDSGVTDADKAMAAKLVSRWEDGLTYPLRRVLGTKRLLEGFGEGGEGPNGQGRRPYAFSISCALQAGMNVLDDLGVPYDNTHDDIVDHFCATCSPPIQPRTAYCIGDPGDPDKESGFILDDIHHFTIEKCSFSRPADKASFQKEIAELRDNCSAKAVSKDQLAWQAVTADEIDNYTDALCAAYLKDGHNFGEVQALRSQMSCARIDVKAVESHVFTRLGEKWGVKHYNPAAASDINHGVFAGGHGVVGTGGDYLVDGVLIRNETNIAIGQPGVGKTLHALQLAHSMVHGTPFLFGKAPQALKDDEIILIIETDAGQSAETSIDRYETMLGYKNDPKWSKHVRVRRADSHTKANAWCIHPRDLQWLYDYITTNNVVLVVIDSLSSACNDSPLEAADEQENAFTVIYDTINSMVSQHSTLFWLHHTRKDGKFGGVTSITRKPSTVHLLTKKEDQRSGLTHYFWKQEKTRNMDEKTYEVFMGPDFRFFVAGKDVKFDLQSAVMAVLFNAEKGLTISQMLGKLEMGIPGLMRDRRMSEDQEEVVLELHPNALPNGGDPAANGGQGDAPVERRLPANWKFPAVSRPTLSRGVTTMLNKGYLVEGPAFKGATRSSKTFLLSDAGMAMAKPVTDALVAAGFLKDRNWARKADHRPEGLVGDDPVTEVEAEMLAASREMDAA